jgi:GMP synthase (glutamine-hydrolysing)
MRPLLFLQIRPETAVADDELRAVLEYGRLAREDVDRIRVDRDGVPVFDPDRWSGIVVGGSPFEVTTPPERKSELQKSIEAGFTPFLQRVLEEDFPFLGACSGHGLLGAYCGAAMSGRHAETVGPATVALSSEGRLDPLLDGFPESFDVFVGHKEALDELPAGAVLLVRGEVCPVQMFRIGRNVYSTQFHPEGDPAGFGLRIRYYRDHGYFRPEEADARLAAVAGVRTPWAQKVLHRFVRRYRDDA